jgi:RsiW-degrading membrane proteinase PrsW (M82 family)
MDIDVIPRILYIYLIIHYIIAMYCIIDMNKWHKMSIRWRFFWTVVVLLNTMLMICYFIFRKEHHQRYVDRINREE